MKGHIAMIKLVWVVWPKPVGGTQGNPIEKVTFVRDMVSMWTAILDLKTKYGENLISVDMTQRVYGKLSSKT